MRVGFALGGRFVVLLLPIALSLLQSRVALFTVTGRFQFTTVRSRSSHIQLVDREAIEDWL